MKTAQQHTTKQAFFAKLREKARCVAGDSFAEVLVAILVAALAASLLATMVMSSVNVTMANESKLTNLHTAESKLASSSTKGVASNVTISSPSIAGPVTKDVTVYSEGDYTRYELS